METGPDHQDHQGEVAGEEPRAGVAAVPVVTVADGPVTQAPPPVGQVLHRHAVLGHGAQPRHLAARPRSRTLHAGRGRPEGGRQAGDVAEGEVEAGDGGGGGEGAVDQVDGGDVLGEVAYPAPQGQAWGELKMEKKINGN